MTILFPQKLKREKLDNQFLKILEIFKQIHINIPFTDALLQMPSYAKFLKEIFSSKKKLEEVSVVMITEKCSAILQNKLPQNLVIQVDLQFHALWEEYSLKKALCDSGASINLMSFSIFRKLNLGEMKDIGVSLQFADQNEFKDDQLIPDSMERCLAKSGTIQDDDPIIRREAEILEKDSEEEEMQPEQVQPKIELKVLPSHLKYVYFEEELFPIIISSSLIAGQEEKLIEVLKAHKGALGWTIEDIKGINPIVCTHKILMEDSYRPIVQPQRRLNLAMQEVVKKEIIKLLVAGIIYPISDIPWVSPVQVVPKKGGMTVIKNESNKCIPTRTVTGWRVCIDYRRLNDATRKDHFPLPFIDQMLERIVGYDFYYFFDGYSGYNQIPIAPEDQDKTTFTCPHGTYAYRRIPFSLCNAPATFQRCMSAIFSDMTENFLEIFMDDFTLFGKTFEDCLHHLTLVLKRCEETNLILNWKKSHFMVTEGIILGHKITAKGIEVEG
ncbi:uncharacterized protein [Nicotiana tomentosiformis]|uniref:uncharacterized protein n=1 Tax=Nicotiana tomentosiformis TaxID=4098 RepID=UPI00388CBC51